MKRALIVLVIALLLAAAWNAGQRLNPAIIVAHPRQGFAVQAVYATGTVEATVMMPIAPRTGARLMRLNVDEGSHVRQGEVLAQLEDEDLQNEMAQLTARSEFAKKQYDRQLALLKKDFVARAEVDRARADWDAAKAAEEKVRAEAGFMQLLAPADGLVIKRDGEVGQMIAANQPVFWLSCCAPLRISAEVDEEDIAEVKPGQKVLIRADAFPGQIFHGQVQAITPKGDPIARSYRVRVSFDEKAPLQIGMTAETNIIIAERENALLVPSSAIVNDLLWLVKEGKLKRQPVAMGAKGPQQTEIMSGVAADSLVVVKPDASLAEGKSVRAELTDLPPP